MGAVLVFPIPPHIYALLRITLGVVGLLTLVRLGDMSFWNPETGFISDRWLVGLKEAARSGGWGWLAGGLIYGLCVASFGLMAVGFKSNVMVVLALIAQLVQLRWNDLPLSGGHPTMQSLLFCLMWADTGAVWSADAWLERRRGASLPPQPASIAPLRLLRFQVALIYFSAGLWKLMNPSWRDGTALHYVLNNNVFHRFPEALAPSLEGLATLGTYLTLFWELGFAFMLLWRPTRYFVLALGVLMHLGILASIEIGPFHFVMLAVYAAFLEPETIAKLFGRQESMTRLAVSVGQTTR